jgi:hypothetical protein
MIHVVCTYPENAERDVNNYTKESARKRRRQR